MVRFNQVMSVWETIMQPLKNDSFEVNNSGELFWCVLKGGCERIWIPWLWVYEQRHENIRNLRWKTFWQILQHGWALRTGRGRSQSRKSPNTVWLRLEEAPRASSQRQKAEWGLPGAGGVGSGERGVSVWRVQGISFARWKGLGMEGGDGCTTVCMFLMPLNFIFKMVSRVRFVGCILLW